MLNDETKKRNQLKKEHKKQPKSIRQTCDPGHEIKITS
jgi:hypothetical protein